MACKWPVEAPKLLAGTGAATLPKFAAMPFQSCRVVRLQRSRSQPVIVLRATATGVAARPDPMVCKAAPVGPMLAASSKQPPAKALRHSDTTATLQRRYSGKRSVAQA